jgi:hypothetical protein
VVVVAAFILPEFLDSPAVRAQIQRKLSEAVGGEVAWDDLSIRILPAPRGVLRKARVEIPGIASVRADEVDVRLLLWPLLRGHAEILSLNLARPEIRIDIATSPPVSGAKKDGDAGGADPFAIYRSVMEPVAGYFRQFAPDTVISVEDALVNVRAPGMPPFELRNLSVRVQSGLEGLDLELTTASNYWNRLKLSARIEFSDLAAKASLDVTEVRPQAWLDSFLAKSSIRVEVPAANLRARASYDAKASLECDFDVTAGAVDLWHAKEHIRVTDTGLIGNVTVGAQDIAVGLEEVRLGASRLQGVKLRYGMKSSALAGDAEFDLDLKQGLDYTRRLVPEDAGAALAWFQQVMGRAQGSVKLDLGQPDWSVGVNIRKSDVAVQIRDLPGPVRLAGGAVDVNRHGVKVDRVALSTPAGEVLLSTLRHSYNNGTTTGRAQFNLDLATSLELARRLVPEKDRAVIARIQSVAGRAHGSVKFDLGQRNWSVGVDVHKSDVSVQIRDLPDPLKISSGSVESSPRAVKVDRVALAMRDTQALLRTLSYSFDDSTTAGAVDFDLDLAQAVDLARRLLPEENRAALADIQSVTGRAQGNAKFAVSGDQWNAGVNILKSDSSTQVRQLPGPVSITGGSVQIDPKTVSVDRVALAMLDAQALISATARDYRSELLQATASIPEGTVGGKFLAWIWSITHAPQHLGLKTPIRVAATRVGWGPKGALDVEATAQFDSGPAVAVEMGWKPGALNIRRVAVKDVRSDAAIAIRTEGQLLEGRFSGTLDSLSIAAMLTSETVPSGAVAGDLRFVVDRENPSRTTAEGNLKGAALDLSWLLRRPVKIDRIDLAADGSGLRIGEASINWAGQRATIRGEVKHGASGPVIDAQLDSPGVNLDALLAPGDKTAKGKTPAEDRDLKRPPEEKGELAWLWPLPVTGRIAVRSDFVHYGRYKVAPVAAALVLESQRAHLDLSQAQLCGISLPLTIEAKPQSFAASTRIAAKQQQLEQAAHCLTDQGVLITGDFDLQADLGTQGKAGDLVRNLKGTVRADVRDGRVMKFALLGNILSMGNIAALLEKEGPRLDDKGFPYRSVKISGHFHEGRFIVEESAFSSDAVGLAATGWISILDYQSRLSVLVAPFGRIDRLARTVPILGYIMGGALTSVPVGVSGDIRNPLVVPLGPSAITSELVGIFERTLKLPGKLIAPLDGGGQAQPPGSK